MAENEGGGNSGDKIESGELYKYLGKVQGVCGCLSGIPPLLI
jgi:hypothetical protein